MIDEKNRDGNPRNELFDYTKGIGVVLVILGHMTTYSRLVRSAIYSFHMPLFFFITGALIYEHVPSVRFSSYFKKKVNTILIPGFFFELLMYLWGLIKNYIEPEIHGMGYIKRFLGIFLQIGYSEYDGALWYLFTYFAVILILYPLWKLISGKPFLSLILGTVFISISYIIVFTNSDIFLIWHAEIIPACMGYVLLGYFARYAVIKIKANKRSICFYIVSVVASWGRLSEN